MKQFNQYIEDTDFTLLQQFFREHGTPKQIKKKECFMLQNSKPFYMGYVESGIFRCIRTDTRGNEHILGYAFQNKYIGDYTSCLRQTPSLVTIQAAVDAFIYMLSFEVMYSFWETNIETQRLGRIEAEQLFAQLYERVVSLHCEIPEERYLILLIQCPEISNILTLKEIALYLNVTPETVSHIRKRILFGKKS